MSNTYWIERGFKWNPIDHMREACANKPIAGGKTYKRPTIMHAHLNEQYPAGSHERFIYEIQAGWKHARKIALDDYCRAVYPERYELIEDFK